MAYYESHGEKERARFWLIVRAHCERHAKQEFPEVRDEA